jgi:hypothetical protein
MATLNLVDTENGDTISFTSPMADANLKGTHPIQNLGAVETYQRRYLYMAALEIVEHDAIDASKPIEGSSVINRDQLEQVQDLIAATQSDVAAICKKLKVASLKEMTQDQFTYVVGVLEKKKG